MNTIQLILEMLKLLEGLAPEIIDIFDKHGAITTETPTVPKKPGITSGQITTN